MTEWVLPLGQVGKESVPTVGGKGANLGEMVRAGLPVPPGFVLTTAAYRSFVATYGLEAEIERLVGQARPEEPSSVDEASAAIRSLFEAKPIPDGIQQSIVEAYAGWGNGPVAVRSSATAEDLPEMSFAGQQESYLNIMDDQALVNAVRRCWSSLWTARAIAYRAREGILPAEVSIAVVIQRLVPAEVSGILFTANPVNGRRDQLVIDAAWGLGEAIVSGQVTPDHWVIDRSTRAVVEAQPGRKTVMTVRTEAGTALVPVSPVAQERLSLSADDLAALAKLGEKLAAHFGSPQDAEWAKESGLLYLLQSRPITSLFPLPTPAPPEAGLRVYACANFLQGFPEPLTPMGIATFRNLSRGIAAILGTRLPPGQAPDAFKVAAGRIYVDITPALQHPRTRVALLAVPRIIDRPMAAIFHLLLDREPSLSPPNPRFPIKPSAGLLISLSRLGLTVLAPALGRRMAVAAIEGYIKRAEERAAHLNGTGERLKFFEDEGPALFPKIMRDYLGIPLVVPAMAARFLAESKLNAWLGNASGLQPVLRSLPHNPTTEMDLALWRVSRKLKDESSQPSAEHPAVKDFLIRYGHRGVREIDLGMPCWQDDPTPVLEMLQNYLSHGDDSEYPSELGGRGRVSLPGWRPPPGEETSPLPPIRNSVEADPEAQFRRGAEEAERAAADLVAQVRRRKGVLRAALLRFLLDRIRALLGTREYPKFMAMKLFATYREVLAGAGAELVEGGRLDRAEDVFFLDLRDLASDRDLRGLAETNRAEYRRELRRRAVPRVMTSTGEAFYGATEVREGALVGTPASPGIYEGPVRVTRDPRGAHLERGEVLVAPGTDPAWTPLFLTAGALVMEIGGIMSHGSVVAREYGIPAVVGVAGATERLKTGQRVRVDGESGLVLPLEP